MEYYSHTTPIKYLLREHLLIVAQRSKEIVLSKHFDFVDKNILAEISFLIGASHDFGKYTTFFQKKLSGYVLNDKYLANHSFISALFGFELINQFLTKKNLLNNSPYQFFPMIAYFIIKHHHGNLTNIEDDITPQNIFESFKRVHEQLQDIYDNKEKIIAEYIDYLKIENKLFRDSFDNLAKFIIPIKESAQIPKIIQNLNKSVFYFGIENKENAVYFITLFLYSILIDSDKKHAGDVRKISRKYIPDDLVDIYLSSDEFKENNTSKLNNIRNKIYNSVTNNITKPENLNKKIFTITAPTGTGKTLTSFSAALKLRQKLKQNDNIDYRIIYSLPFTSIIDQSHSEFHKVLSLVPDFQASENEFLLKHHHLSDIIFRSQNSDTEINIDESLALIESWESEIIVTTFIQFFYAVIGYKNRSLKKFHNIVNSIIILDEVQNIPIRYWKLINIVLRDLANYFNSRIILMTATKPLIFEGNEFSELVNNYDNYFEHSELNRVKININKSKVTIQEFADSLPLHNDNSYLFVFNTVGSAYEFHKIISSKVDNTKDRLFFLSTNITPRERKARIIDIKKLLCLKNKGNKRIGKTIIVSTQLIEAGVDIDCDCVYRDIGPLDSIIQVAGRCNRNKRFPLADMNLVSLVNENERLYSNFIYDPVLIFVLDQLLNKRGDLQENEFLKLINEYFVSVHQKVASEKNIIDAISNLMFDSSESNMRNSTIAGFNLIAKDFPSIDIFIELDNNARKTWNTYQQIKSNKNLTGLQKRNEFLKIRKQFNDYIISVPKSYAAGFEEGIINYVSKGELPTYYDLETGFKRDTAGRGTMII